MECDGGEDGKNADTKNADSRPPSPSLRKQHWEGNRMAIPSKMIRKKQCRGGSVMTQGIIVAITVYYFDVCVFCMAATRLSPGSPANTATTDTNFSLSHLFCFCCCVVIVVEKRKKNSMPPSQ